ncbi:MAG: 4-alpha-glucanotransferase [Rhodospirillales bacterium]
MPTSQDLDRLAWLAGVEPEYWDIWGHHHPVDEAGMRAILGALGCGAANEGEIETSLGRLEDASWRRTLPPVLIVYEGAAVTVPVVLPRQALALPIDCRVVREDGSCTEFVFRPTTVAIDAERRLDGADLVRLTLAVAGELPLGYHRLVLGDDETAAARKAEMRLIVAPERCYLPPVLAKSGRIWGLSAQLYSLRRPGNWGIGDFTDLASAIDIAADLGADILGLNPLHALFLDRPEWASPYSPSSRQFLNPLYIDVEAVPEFANCPEAATLVRHAADEINAWRDASHVPYADIAPFKRKVLYALYEWFVRPEYENAHPQRQAAFERFCEAEGVQLVRFALFNVLAETFPGKPWQEWPAGYGRPDTPECEAFAKEHAARIEFYMYLQWIADEQLGAAKARADTSGMAVGLYVDLAVGAAREGADAWANPELILQQAKVGCPPDPFNMLGQDWSIPPLHPQRLRELGYEPFIAMLRANMRHAGAIRIDHVMGLMHLFWIPADQPPARGAYVKYPFDDLLALVALESQRARCLVVGEDLGTVPDGFRERMAAAAVLSYRVLYFERIDDRFKRPGEYPALALACVTTHDLATLWGYWRGADIALKHELAQYPSEEAYEGEKRARVHERHLLLQMLATEGLLPPGRDPNNVDAAPMDAKLAAALHAFLARSPSQILLVQIDDLMEEQEQINLPGTNEERPNWRRKLSQPVEALPRMGTVRCLEPVLRQREGTVPVPR